ncbi:MULTISPECIES: carbohydrate ABC transporter permease [unclassified Nocardioides]|uniref:carbohydrate ABC transporter permease n=1 Tax=unclassified Nocardioides TaxID=2615069 RepID=UPI0009F0D89B|nr:MULTISPECIES: carbohydrate ABC transporter permease [unclassified Nocardioides]GAW50133.1 Putative sugar ABC transporter permease protein [Nocardioides sp. PD653-B2]GAW54818.1 putative sugar ABC transporter permease protein [Nocardioides sp. PD653]
MNRRHSQAVGRVLKPIIGVAITAVMLSPLLWMISASLQTRTQLYEIPAHILPPTPTLANFEAVISTQIGSLGTSVVISVATAILSLIISVPAAYALAQRQFRWTGTIVLLLLITQMIPNVMTATPFYLMFSRLGLVNSYPALVLADSTYAVPFAILVLRAFFVEVPAELREAALIDGAGELGALLRVVLPVVRTGVIAVGMFCFLFAWADFVYALTLSTDGSVVPFTLSIYSFIGAQQTNWNELMAAAVLGIIPGAVLLIGAQRYIAAGLIGGAVKG